MEWTWRAVGAVQQLSNQRRRVKVCALEGRDNHIAINIFAEASFLYLSLPFPTRSLAAMLIENATSLFYSPSFAIHPHQTEHTNTLSYTSREAERKESETQERRRGICWAGDEGWDSTEIKEKRNGEKKGLISYTHTHPRISQSTTRFLLLQRVFFLLISKR